MGKKIKKGTRGEATKYITRSQALRKLQLTLREFRRLCILKGIFPKEPKKKFKGVNKTYYYLKDIKFLSHEKLLRKFREIQSFEKKINKAKKKKERFDADQLTKNKPKYSLEHIIRERYPRFIDAVGDLDDALSLISLFSILPKHELLKINAETVNLCRRLLNEFLLYCVASQNLKKSFISIKGIYLTVEVLGSEITWLSPFNAPQKLTYDIDYEIMVNYLELYTNLLKFVNFKLFKDVNMEYPPKENSELPFFGFNSLNLRQIQESVSKNNQEERSKLREELNLDSEELEKIMKSEDDAKTLKNLFKNCVFFVSREIPKEIFGLSILSCGGIYGDDTEQSAVEEDDNRITHYIVDRPAEFIQMKVNKEYIQPQWILDCINSKKLLPTANYQPGKKLPPHLSPYYEFSEEGYKPKVPSNDEEEPETLEESKQKEEEENTKLKEMLISKNKKKLLEKIREEKQKKKRKLKNKE